MAAREICWLWMSSICFLRSAARSTCGVVFFRLRRTSSQSDSDSVELSLTMESERNESEDSEDSLSLHSEMYLRCPSEKEKKIVLVLSWNSRSFPYRDVDRNYLMSKWLYRLFIFSSSRVLKLFLKKLFKSLAVGLSVGRAPNPPLEIVSNAADWWNIMARVCVRP